MEAKATMETIGNRESAIAVLSHHADRLEARAAGLRALRDAIIMAQALRQPGADEDEDAAVIPIGNGSPAEIAVWDLVINYRYR